MAESKAKNAENEIEKEEEKKAKKPKQEAALTAFMCAPQFEIEHWATAAHEPIPPNCPRESGYDSDIVAWARYDTAKAAHDEILAALESARAGDVKPLLEWMAARLAPCEIKAIYGVLHDKDTEENFDIESGMKKIVEISPHCQTLVIFEKTNKYNANRTIKNISVALGLPENMIEKPKQGRYSIDNQLAYLTHVKYADKYPYSPRDVISIVPEGATGEEYTAIYERRYNDWRRGRGTVSAKKAEVNLESLLDEIAEGRVTKRQILMNKELFSVYIRYRRQINDAFKGYIEKREEINAAGLEDGEFKKRVIFVYGMPRSGKSHLAKAFAKKLVEMSKETGEPWRIKRLASKNPFDKYTGEEVVIADDWRDETLSRAEWLHFLNVDDAEEQAARFQNVRVAPRLIIFTAPIDPVSFFTPLRGEDINQYIGRIELAVAVANPNLKNQELTTFKVGKRKTVAPYEVQEKILNFAFDFDEKTYFCDGAVDKAIELLEAQSIENDENENPLLCDPSFDPDADEYFFQNLEENYNLYRNSEYSENEPENSESKIMSESEFKQLDLGPEFTKAIAKIPD